MKKKQWLVLVMLILITSACGVSTSIETDIPTETAIPLIRFISPSEGATLNYDNLYFQVNPVPGAEGYAWIFLQDGNILLDTLKEEQRLTDTTYRIPDIVSRNKNFRMGELQVQVRARIKGVWTEPSTITVYLPEQTIAEVPTRSPSSTPKPTKVPATKVLSMRERFEAIAKQWHITYYDGGKICFMAGDGSGSSCLDVLQSDYGYGKGEHPAWSPDGQSILVVPDKGNDIHMNLCVLPVEGGEMKCLTKNRESSIMFFEPDWSPDGSQIVYSSTQAQKSLGQWWAEDIYVARANGKDPVKLTDSKSGNRYPVWSPTGDWIVFQSDRTTWEAAVDTELFLIKPNGTGIRQLTDSSDGMYSLHPSWSPDGEWIVYETSPNPYTNSPQYFLQVIKVDGSSKRLLGGPYTSPTYPQWTPDGNFIVFTDKAISLPDNEIFDLGFHPHYGDWIALPSSVDLPVAPTPNCAAGWTRLEIGMYAMVVPGDPNRVRSEPGKSSEVIGQLYPGTASIVVEGPICADGLVFWKVENSTIPGGSGWTAEGDGKEYWLEPYK